jgi:hypothetical protein
MNKRIEELYIKAHISQEPIHGTARLTKDILWEQADKFDYETFANLIIRECAELATIEYDKRGAINGTDLLEHFGIKE